jgi:dTDP-4-dehydrorhamnose reductase
VAGRVEASCPLPEDPGPIRPCSIERIFAETRWDAVISSGAYTAVDKAETDVLDAWRVNALSPCHHREAYG